VFTKSVQLKKDHFLQDRKEGLENGRNI